MTSTHWVIYAIFLVAGFLTPGLVGLWMLGVAGGLGLHLLITSLKRLGEIK